MVLVHQSNFLESCPHEATLPSNLMGKVGDLLIKMLIKARIYSTAVCLGINREAYLSLLLVG